MKRTNLKFCESCIYFLHKDHAVEVYSRVPDGPAGHRVMLGAPSVLFVPCSQSATQQLRLCKWFQAQVIQVLTGFVVTCLKAHNIGHERN